MIDGEGWVKYSDAVKNGASSDPSKESAEWIQARKKIVTACKSYFQLNGLNNPFYMLSWPYHRKVIAACNAELKAMEECKNKTKEKAGAKPVSMKIMYDILASSDGKVGGT